MKEAVAGILQTRMDKCTAEQFWAIGALMAYGGFLTATKASLGGQVVGSGGLKPYDRRSPG